jgi:hypothetical protein
MQNTPKTRVARPRLNTVIVFFLGIKEIRALPGNSVACWLRATTPPCTVECERFVTPSEPIRISTPVTLARRIDLEARTPAMVYAHENIVRQLNSSL